MPQFAEMLAKSLGAQIRTNSAALIGRLRDWIVRLQVDNLMILIEQVKC